MKLRKKSNYPVLTAEFKSVAELAGVMDVSEKTAQRVLNGYRPFYHKEKLSICNYLGRPVSEVFGNE